MKLMHDWQIEIVTIEDISNEKVKKLIDRYGSIEAIKEELQNIMAAELKNLFEIEPSKLDIKIKVFELEK